MTQACLVSIVLASLSVVNALVVKHTSPVPVPAAAPAPGQWQVLPTPVSLVPSPAAPPAAAPSAACDPNGPLCQDVAKLRELQRLGENLAIANHVNDTTRLIDTEVARLVQLVHLSVKEQESYEMASLEQKVREALMQRVQAFTDAVHGRQMQVVGSEARQFAVEQEHEKKLMEAIALDLEQHGYQIAKDAVAREAGAAAARFATNPLVHSSMRELATAGVAWAKSYHTTQTAAKTGLDAWSSSYGLLNATWKNVTGAFAETNRASIAAKGLDEEQLWVAQTVRVSADVVQAAETQSQYSGAEEAKMRQMVTQTERIISGNSGAIETLTNQLDETSNKVQQAQMVA